MRINTAAWTCAALLATVPALAQGNGNGNSQGNGSSQDQMATFPPGASGTLQRGAAGQGKNSGPAPLIDHGGKLLPASHVYFIWWGTGSFPSDAMAGMTALASGLNGSSFLGITDQYMRGGTSTTSYVDSAIDASVSPGHAPSTSTIVSEACKVITQKGWVLDTNALYTVVTSNFPNGANYCAWHSHGTCNGTDIEVAYLPNTTGVAGCDPGDLYSCNSYSQGTRSLANVFSHEFSEAITDPDLNAWYDKNGEEIGDKCAWTFASCVKLKNGSWQLQQEWSNSANACVQQ